MYAEAVSVESPKAPVVEWPSTNAIFQTAQLGLGCTVALERSKYEQTIHQNSPGSS